MTTTIDPALLQVPNAEQMDAYNKPMPPPALPGRYAGIVGSEFQFEEHDGFLRVLILDIYIPDAPQGADNHVKYDRCSAKPRESGRMAGTSRLTDFLLAAGLTRDDITNTAAEDYPALIESTAGSTVEFQLGWTCWDSEGQESLADRYEEFPDDPENLGEKLPFCETSDGRKVPARGRILYYVRPR